MLLGAKTTVMGSPADAVVMTMTTGEKKTVKSPAFGSVFSLQTTISTWNSAISQIVPASYASKIRTIEVADRLITSIASATMTGSSNYHKPSYPLTNLQRFVDKKGTIAVVGSSAFVNCSTLREVDLPGCVLISSNAAFSSCTQLQTVNIPNCECISWGAFNNCSNLKSIYAPKCSFIAATAFFGCTTISTITADACQQFWWSTLANHLHGCSNLATFHIDNSVLKSFDDGYGNSDRLIVQLSNNTLMFVTPKTGSAVNSQVESIFSYAANINKTISHAAFPNCRRIDLRAFAGCSNLRTISFPRCTMMSSTTFAECTSLQSAEFPVLESILQSTFYNCTALQTASFPNCTAIGSTAFYLCSTLSSIYAPACTSIDAHAFYYDNALQSVSFPECVSLGTCAFKMNSLWSGPRLESIYFPKCEYLGNTVFEYCTFSRAYFPECSTINAFAFSDMPNLVDISVPKMRTTTRIFTRCPNISRIFVDNDKLHSIENGSGCPDQMVVDSTGSILYMTAPTASLVSNSNITSLAGYAVYQCSNLTNISFPNCATIESFGIAWCPNITTVSFPLCSSMKSNAFYYCSSLASIYLMNVYIPSISSNTFTSNAASLSIYVREKLYSKYLSSTYWSTLSSRIVSVPYDASADGCFVKFRLLDDSEISISNDDYLTISTTAAWKGVLRPMSSINTWTNKYSTFLDRSIASQTTSVEIHDKYTTRLGSYAFCGTGTYTSTFSRLTTISDTLGTVVTLFSSAFYSCTSLTHASFPACATFQSTTFYNCKNLASFYVSNSTQHSTDDGFGNADAVILADNGSQLRFVVPAATKIANNDMTSISLYALVNSPNLSQIIVSNSAIKSTDDGYGNSHALVVDQTETTLIKGVPTATSVFNSAITQVDSGAFYNCQKLKSVDLPSCTSVSDFAFYNCTSLTSVNMPRCQYISNYGFNGCYYVKNFSFPECSYVGVGGFQNCYYTQSIDLPKCEQLEYSALYYCQTLTKVVLPKCSFIGSSAFALCKSLATVVLPSTSVVTGNPSMFYSTNSTYKVYVHPTVYSNYLTASYWTDISANIYAMDIDLQNAEISRISDAYVETGEPICPVPTVVLNGIELVNGRDFTTSYQNNIQKGTATIVISGIGVYTNDVTKTFQIIADPSTKINIETTRQNEVFGVYSATKKSDSESITIDWGD